MATFSWRWTLKGQNWLRCLSGLSRVLLIRWVWLNFLFLFLDPDELKLASILLNFLIFLSLDPGGTTCHGTSSAANTPTEKATSFHLLSSVAKGFSLLNRFQWLLKVLQQLYTLGFRVISHEVNMTVSEFRKQLEELMFAGEEPICYKGLPCLPRSRPHARLSLELPWPELVMRRGDKSPDDSNSARAERKQKPTSRSSSGWIFSPRVNLLLQHFN